jgi:RNA polymerase sigma-70 factor, ECF subfamily
MLRLARGNASGIMRLPSKYREEPRRLTRIDCTVLPRSGYNLTVAFPNLSTKSGAGPSDAALVVAARADERWAKEALFRRYASMVNGLAYRLVGRDADLDDLVQDSFTEAWRSLGRLDAPQAFGAWLGSIVVRTAHKMLRRRRLLTRLGFRRRDPVEFENLISPGAPPDARAELLAVYRLVEKLPSTTRVALLLRRVEGLPLDEIARLLGVSLATVKRRLAEAERQLGAADPMPTGDA